MCRLKPTCWHIEVACIGASACEGRCVGGAPNWVVEGLVHVPVLEVHQLQGNAREVANHHMRL